jgi:hypothetical protein
MKFNQAKWEAMQQRKASLHQIFSTVDADWHHARDEYAQQLAHFRHNYREYRGCQTALQVLEHDARTLTAAEIGAQLEQLRHAWPSACEAFGVSAGFAGQHALVRLYELMLTRRKLEDAKNQASEKAGAFGACFARLNEFAAKHGNGDPTRYALVPDRSPIDGVY